MALLVKSYDCLHKSPDSSRNEVQEPRTDVVNQGVEHAIALFEPEDLIPQFGHKLISSELDSPGGDQRGLMADVENRRKSYHGLDLGSVILITMEDVGKPELLGALTMADVEQLILRSLLKDGVDESGLVIQGHLVERVVPVLLVLHGQVYMLVAIHSPSVVAKPDVVAFPSQDVGWSVIRSVEEPGASDVYQAMVEVDGIKARVESVWVVNMPQLVDIAVGRSDIEGLKSQAKCLDLLRRSQLGRLRNRLLLVDKVFHEGDDELL